MLDPEDNLARKSNHTTSRFFCCCREVLTHSPLHIRWTPLITNVAQQRASCSRKIEWQADNDASRCGTPLTDEISRFKHVPCDGSKAPIRLVHLRSDLSPKGYLQYRIQQSTIDDQYCSRAFITSKCLLGININIVILLLSILLVSYAL